MPYRNARKQRAYQRRWYAERRAAWIAAQGGACGRCGRTCQLEVDHIDPTRKLSHRVWSWSDARRTAELANCQVLCRYCHDLKSARDGSRHRLSAAVRHDIHHDGSRHAA